MTGTLSEQLASRLSRSVSDQLGLYFPRDRWPDLERGLRSAAPKLGHPDAEECAEWMLSAPLSREAMNIMAGELTVGETYFFREKRCLEILAERILPQLVRARQVSERRLRIWSAGCCTGEEPYSIAILIDRLLPEFREWDVTILGTDINPHFLNKAKEGIYGEWSFREPPPWLKPHYFEQVDEKHFQVAAHIREKVVFAPLNLMEDVYPAVENKTAGMDIIFCRNVLMYFTPEGMKGVVGHFHRSLRDGGWFFVGLAETSCELFTPFFPVDFGGAFLYRKGKPSPQDPMMPSVEKERSDEAPLIAPTPILALVTDALPEVIAPEAAIVPDDPQPSAYDEALALFGRGKCADAAEKLRAGVDSGSVSAQSAELLARIWANLGDLPQARAWVEKAIAAEKLNPVLHYLRAIILQEQGAGEESVAAWNRTLYLDPKFVPAHFALGNVALREKRFEQADKHFANVLALLADYQPDDLLSQTDGLVAGRLREMTVVAMSSGRDE